MKKIHRKNQVWLYQKFKQEQKENNIQKIYIESSKSQKNSDCEERKERLYIFLDMAVYIIPLCMALIGFLLLL